MPRTLRLVASNARGNSRFFVAVEVDHLAKPGRQFVSRHARFHLLAIEISR